MGLLSWLKERRKVSKTIESSHLLSALPADRIGISSNRLISGPGANDHLMSVDGSSTPVDFEWGPGVGELAIVHSLAGLIIDPGAMTHDSFGSIPGGLSNGIDMIAKIGGIEHKMAFIENNACMAVCFSGGVMSPAAPTVADQGFMDTNDFMAGNFNLPYPATLNGDDGDKIIMRVQDNLVAVELLRVNVIASQIIATN